MSSNLEPGVELIVYDALHIESLTKKRSGEIRFGEKVKTLPWNKKSNLENALSESSCRYVILGLPEDIGVRANFGRGGAYSAWQPVLSTLLNVQSNAFLTGEELLVLGHLDFSSAMEKVKNLNFQNKEDLQFARSVVSEIDNIVAPYIKTIVASGKEPIIIGGGHNNALPNITGAAQGLFANKKIKKTRINCINCDAHSDLRPLEGRHSGNAFSYALENGFLENYAMVGLHEIFNTSAVVEKIMTDPNLDATFFEAFSVLENITFTEAIDQAIQFTKNNYIGLELDLDAIQNIPSSAKTSSGISTIQARQFVHQVASKCAVAYFHIAEAAPVLSHIKTDLKTGKLIAYLITDYLKARNKYHETAH